MSRLFGTDGVRGIANLELSGNLAFELGRAGASVLAAESGKPPVIIVGTDTRISADMLEAALVSGICSAGASAVCLGVVPTPAVAYLTRYYGADAGVVISASHNPYEFNGIKFFNRDGYKLTDTVEDQIEGIIKGNNRIPVWTAESNIGRRIFRQSAAGDYTAYLETVAGTRLDGVKITLDCANGAASAIAPALFEALGAEVAVIHNKPDGTNINMKCGSTHIRDLLEFTVHSGSDAGFAFDGDADRVLAADRKGRLVDGDHMLAVAGVFLKKQGKLASNTIVATVMSNLGFDKMASENGISVVKTRVGDRYVLEEMLENGYNLGGEQSGHIIFRDCNTTGDGLITAIRILEAMVHSGKTLDELASVMQVMPQVLKNAKVKNGNQHKYMEDERVAGMCRALELEFKGDGRVLIRPSGTEPLVRVMIEGQDLHYITERAVELVRIIEERWG